LDPTDGSERWAYDTREAIRSSPAVDALGNVYVGSGEGRLFVLNPDGTLRWSMQLIEGDRNDLNASPALGVDAVYIAGESGEIFSVPLDYCLRPAALDDARCTTEGGEALPDEGARLLFTTHFGSPLTTPPDTIEANQPLAFTLLLREDGDTRLALLDTDSVEVTLDPPKGVTVEVSANRAFLTVRPDGAFAADADGRVRVTVAADYLIDPARTGLRFEGGTRAGRVEQTFEFAVAPGVAGPLPLALPAGPGEAGGVWELHRLAAPLPTILPSYNQIGFDSLHYLVALVEGDDRQAVAWVLGARLDAAGRTVPDPATKALFPLALAHDDQRVTLTNHDGLALEVLNARIGFDDFHVAARLAADGTVPQPAQVVVSAICGDIPLYGMFLRQLGFCNPATDRLHVFGAALLSPWDDAGAPPPPAVAEIAFEVGPRAARATFLAPSVAADAHVVALLLVDPDTGRPVSLDYGLITRRTLDAEERVQTVEVGWPADAELPSRLRVWLMIDTRPMAVATLDRPTE
ncbi:MAG: PQQ-like beta-propeller repeat protein, partial [Myxococcales bacterium]|nr:PQQ-like beta-propeller repeat protein [Myxococcales bacterium]